MRLLVEYPEGAIPGTPSIRVVLDESFVGDDLDTVPEENYDELEGQDILDAMARNQARYEASLDRQFPYQGDISRAFEALSAGGIPTRASEIQGEVFHRPLADEDEYLGRYLAAVSFPNGTDSPAAKAILDGLGSLYSGFEHNRLGVSSSADVVVVEHATVYDYDWPMCCGGSCVVIRRPDNPYHAPHLSVPYVAVILLGSTGWSGFSQITGHWLATRESLTDEGKALYVALEALYPGHTLRLTTWLDT